MIVAPAKGMRKTRIIDKQEFFLLGESEGPEDVEGWKMVLRSLDIRTRTFKYGSCGIGWSPVYGPEWDIWCNLKDFRKALKRNKLTFRQFLTEFGATIHSSQISLPTGGRK